MHVCIEASIYTIVMPRTLRFLSQDITALGTLRLEWQYTYMFCIIYIYIYIYSVLCNDLYTYIMRDVMR
jgi:hypothetical protein